MVIRSFVSCALAISMAFPAASAAPREVETTTFDGVVIYGDLYEAKAPKDAPIILLFHQAGSNAKGEYGDYIAPKLVEAGYHVLAIDQRLGGDTYGGQNRTVEALEAARDENAPPKVANFCDALPDLDAAVTLARDEGYTGKLALWGSSYSGALVFFTAASRPQDVDAVLAFSPALGSAVRDCSLEAMIGQLNIPMFTARPSIEMRRPTVIEQVMTLTRHDVYFMVSSPGAHGSSMLHPERAERAEATWASVLAWLDYALRDGEKPAPQEQSRHSRPANDGGDQRPQSEEPGR